MAAGDLVVNGVTYSLPAPMQNGYTERPKFRGSLHRMASGAPAWEFTSTSPFGDGTTEWSNITAAQAAVVNNAVAALVTYGTGTWTTWTGATWTVTLGDGGFPEWTIRRRLGTNTYFYTGKLTLERTA